MFAISQAMLFGPEELSVIPQLLPLSWHGWDLLSLASKKFSFEQLITLIFYVF